MVEWITKINGMVNGIVWGPIGLALLFCTGLWMTLRTGGFQFRRVGHWMRHTIGAVFTNKEVTAHTSKEDMAISHGHRLGRAGRHLLDVGHGHSGHDDQLFGKRAGRVLPPQK